MLNIINDLVLSRRSALKYMTSMVISGLAYPLYTKQACGHVLNGGSHSVTVDSVSITVDRSGITADHT